MIDSQGNPGIAGKVIGVETEAALEVLVVGVLTTVIVETDVLTTVAIGELVDVTDSVEAEDVEVLSCEAEVALEVFSVLFCVVVACCCCSPTGGFSGSRCMIPDRLPPLTGRPAAQPSCGPVKKTDRNDMPGVVLPANMGGTRGV
jgi:hypothetical protein